MSTAEKLMTIAENEQKVYDAGKRRGYGEGWEKGLSDGIAEGQRQGHEQGFEAGRIAGYDLGYHSGYTEGRKFGYQEGYGDGHDQGEEEGSASARFSFWNNYQHEGEPITAAFMFAGAGWTKDTFRPVHPIIITSGFSMFRSCGDIGDLETALQECGVYLDTSKATTLEHAFGWSGITRVGKIDTSGMSTLYHTFSQAHNLETIDALCLKDGTQSFTSTFLNCYVLKNITISGVIGNDFDIHWSPLSADSLRSVIRALSAEAVGKTVSFSKAAVEAAFPGASEGTNEEWNNGISAKANWTFVLS